MAHYMVTGAAGFIGARTTEMLLEGGHEVAGVDNFHPYYDIRLKERRLKPLLEHPKFSFHRLDIENRAELAPVFEGTPFSAVINLAARAGVRNSLKNPSAYFETNVLGTLNLLELMRENGVRKLVLASSSSLYAGHPLPFREDQPVNRPISPYAASKKAAEVLAYTYHHLYRIDVSILRYFTVYGPFGRPDMAPFRFIKWIAEGTPVALRGDGSQSRDFSFIDDIAEGTILALREIGYEIINLGGGGHPATIQAMIELIERYLGKSARIENQPSAKADMPATKADIAKAERLLQWKPRVSFEEGVQKAVSWYRENASWLKGIEVEERKC